MASLAGRPTCSIAVSSDWYMFTMIDARCEEQELSTHLWTSGILRLRILRRRTDPTVIAAIDIRTHQIESFALMPLNVYHFNQHGGRMTASDEPQMFRLQLMSLD